MVDDWVRQTRERAEKFQAMAERVGEMSVTERSADGSVRVTVSSKGMLTDLAISEDAAGQRMAEVSASIMRTVRLAQSRIPELLRQAMTETVGTDDQAANHILDEAARTFPEPPEPEPDEALPGERRFDPEIVDDQEPENPPPPSQPQPPPPRRRARDEDDGDDMQDSIFS
ncbi:hypothetical protein BLA60_16975 [Actinophytocola xinjiangensis]|uniref:YbaB/EbfC DNA-binding family protein n=2 Tax=Actinophytocola xinjiangensis TaxID=485602 RepID=A0A7Z1AYB3_9PSEU|nr:hypothetical protein BLA60_16975 [Actinophytocola xinjiangensis]